MKLLQRMQTYLLGLLFSMLAFIQSAQAAGECTNTTGLCTTFVTKLGPMFTDINDLTFWLVLFLLGVVFVFFVFHKIRSGANRS